MINRLNNKFYIKFYKRFNNKSQIFSIKLSKDTYYESYPSMYSTFYYL